MTNDLWAKRPLPVYWFVYRMSHDLQIRQTAALYILPTGYMSCDGGPDTFTHTDRALPLETCLHILPSCHMLRTQQPTALPVIFSLVTFLFHKIITQLLLWEKTPFCIHIEIFCRNIEFNFKLTIITSEIPQCSFLADTQVHWLPFWLEGVNGSLLGTEYGGAQLHGRLHECSFSQGIVGNLISVSTEGLHPLSFFLSQSFNFFFFNSFSHFD